jgi:hypothetical protein
MGKRFTRALQTDAPCSEKLMIPDHKKLTRLGLHPEIEHGHAGGINSPFVPPVDDLFDMALFAAPYERDRFLRTPVFVASQNFDFLEFHLPALSTVAGYYFFTSIFSMEQADL